jgi:hypothetical protein
MDACSRKRRYATKEVALRVARSRSPFWGRETYVYDSCGCGWWHVTKHPTHGGKPNIRA